MQWVKLFGRSVQRVELFRNVCTGFNFLDMLCNGQNVSENVRWVKLLEMCDGFNLLVHVNGLVFLDMCNFDGLFLYVIFCLRI